MPVAELELYDIMHVDDNLDICKLLDEYSRINNLTYHAVGSSLEELKQALEEEKRAMVYVLDREFKRAKDDKTTALLDQEAIALIKQFDENALFIIFASEEPAGIENKVGIYFIRKPSILGVINLAKQLVNQPY